MKNGISFLLFVLLLGFVSKCPGQYYNKLYYNGVRIFDDVHYSQKGDSIIRAHQYNSRQVFETESVSGRERIESVYITEYDSMGRTTHVKGFDRKARQFYEYAYAYDASGREVDQMGRYRKSNYRTSNEFGPYKEPVKITTWYGKKADAMHKTRTIINSFSADSLKILSETFDKNNKHISTVLYEYDSLKKLGTARLFSAKGKLQHSWSFSCNKSGEVIKTAKEARVCTTKQTLENGHTQEITIAENHNNIERTVTEMDENGRFIYSENYTGTYGNQLKTRSEYYHNGDTDRMLVRFYRTQRSDPYYLIENEYVRVNKREVSTAARWYSKPGRLTENKVSTYSHNPDGTIQTSVNTDLLNKKSSISRYYYTRRY